MGQTKGKSFTVQDVTVVDTDAHITESDEQLQPYITDDYPALGKILENEPSPDFTIRSAAHPGPVLGEMYTPEGESEELTRNNGFEMSQATLPSKLKEMEEFGIDKSIVTPTMLLTINSINNPRFGHAYRRAYNSWLEDNFLDQYENVKGAVVVSRHEPNKAAEEIERMASEDDIVAVAFGLGALTPPLGDRTYDPIYEAAENYGLPLLLHGTGGTFAWDYPTQFRDAHTYSEAHVVANPFQAMWHLSESIYRGLPERFPDLDLVFQESGISWIPFTKWRLDDVYMEYPDDAPILSKPPREYIADQYYFTTQPLGHTTGHNEMAKAIELAGAESILYSSDLPHPSFDPPEELFNRIGSYFDEDVVRGMMGETAEELFGL